MYQGPGTGLYSSPNPFSASPAGSLAVADNVRYTAPSVIEPRPGFSPGDDFGSSSSLADALSMYGVQLLAAYDLTKVAIAPTSGGTFTAFSGNFVPVGANRLRFEGAARSIFWNANTGLWVWDGVGVGSQPTLAGNAQGLNLQATNNTANGWQPANSAVAYRFTICSKDAFGRIIEGPPSGRGILRNLIRSTYPTSGVTRSGGTTVHVTTDQPHGLAIGDVVTLTPASANFPAGAKTVTAAPNSIQFDYAEAGANVSATVTQDWEITRSADVTCVLPTKAGKVFCSTSNFLRVYRADPTEDAADVPSDECFLCYESAYLTAGQIAAGVVTFTDVAPISTLEVALYTNQNSGLSEASANFQPPRALDTAYFANRMWFANADSKASLQFAIIGVGSPDGLQVGDTITLEQQLGGANFTLTAAVASAGNDFQVFDDPIYFPGDVGYNIERTARALVDCINNSASNDVFYAYYVSSENGTPGKILLTYADFTTDGPFYVYSSRGTAWNPQLPTFAGPAFLVSSDTNAHAARLWYSKLGQPEAVPLVNFTPCESDNQPILRIFPLHFRLLIFKTDGIYFCTNTEPFNVQKMSSFVLIAPDSVALLDERVFCLTDQGIVSISDGGVDPVSVPIDDILTALGGPTSLEDLKTRAFGVGYRTARQYLLWVLKKNADGTFTDDNAQAFVYSTLSRGFTRYPFGARAALVDPSVDKLVYAPTDDNIVRLENKTLTAADFFDDIFVVIITAINEDQVTLASATGVTAGDVLSRGGCVLLVTEVEGNVLTVLGGGLLTTGPAFVYVAIETELKFNPFTGGEPAVLKMSNQVSLLFRRNDMHSWDAEFASEIAPVSDPIEMVNLSPWGSFAWGELAWGNPPERIRRVEPLPVGVDNCCQLTVGFSTRQALATFEFLGVDARQDEDSEVNGG